MNENDKQQLATFLGAVIVSTSIVVLWAMVLIHKVSDTQERLTTQLEHNLSSIERNAQSISDLEGMLAATIRRLDALEDRKRK